MYVWSHVCKQNEDTKMFGMWELQKLTPSCITALCKARQYNIHYLVALCKMALYRNTDHSDKFALLRTICGGIRG